MMLVMKGRRYKLWLIVMNVVVVCEEDVLIWMHTQQSGRRLKKNSLFTISWKVMHISGDLVMCLGDINGHIGRHINGCYGVHGRHAVGQKKLEGRMLLEFCPEKKICVKCMV